MRLGGAVVAERFLYLPLVGLAAIFGQSVLLVGTAGRRRRAAQLGVGAALAFLAVLTVRRSAVWKDEITLFERTLRDAPDPRDSLVIMTALGEAYQRAGRAAESHRLEGDVLSALGMFPQAIDAYRLIDAAAGGSLPADHRRLGAAYLGAKRFPEAVAEYVRATQETPRDPTDRDQLGLALQGTGDIGAAEAAFRAALQLAPGHPPALLHLGALLTADGRAAEAIPLLERHLAAEPDSASGQNNLGTALYRERRFSEAARALERAKQLDARDPLVRFNLALAYRAGGDGAAAARELRSLSEIDAGLAAELSRMIH